MLRANSVQHAARICNLGQGLEAFPHCVLDWSRCSSVVFRESLSSDVATRCSKELAFFRIGTPRDVCHYPTSQRRSGNRVSVHTTGYDHFIKLMVALIVYLLGTAHNGSIANDGW